MTPADCSWCCGQDLAILGVAVAKDADGWAPLPSRGEAAGTGSQEGSSLSLSLDFLSKSICCLLFVERNGKPVGSGCWVMECADSQPSRD